MEFLDSISYISFYILAATSIICAAGMIWNPNLVRAGFTLIGSFCAIAGIYFLLYANFVAVSQVLIYAVGIVLVLVFAVMLCSLRDNASEMPDTESAEGSVYKTRRTIAKVIALGLFALLYKIIREQNWALIRHLTGAKTHESMIGSFSSEYTTRIGFEMLGDYILPFELVSVLLLIVLVGTIILSKKSLKEQNS